MPNSVFNKSLVPLAGSFLKYLIQIIRVGIIARFLLPEHYGLIASIQGILGLSTIFGDFGLSTASIQKRELSKTNESTFFWLNVFIGLFIMIIIMLIAPLIRDFYNYKEETINIIYLLSLNYLIISIYTQPLVKLKRNLKFKKITSIELFASLTSTIVGIYLAITGYKYWALIYMQLTESIASMILYLYFSKIYYKVYCIDFEVKKTLRFGITVNIMNVLNRISKNIDMVLIGKFVGLSYVGIYSRAVALTNILNNQLRNTIFSVSFPMLSKNQDNDKKFYNSIYETYSVLIFINCLFGGPLFFFADQIIPFYLGPGWESTIPLLKILCLTFIFIPYNTISDQIPLARGDSYFYNKIGIIKNIIRLIGIIIGIIAYGVIGCAIGIAFGELINTIIIMRLFRKFAIDNNTIVVSLFLPLIIVIFTGITIKFCFGNWENSLLKLITSICLFSIFFLVVYMKISIKYFSKVLIKIHK